MNKTRLRNVIISAFVLVWLCLFHYESIRYFYLNPFFKKDLPKTPLLFPPAGWIMFYNVDNTYGWVEVYGIKNKESELIDPHDIFRTRTFGFDNIHRNILSGVADMNSARGFCSFLRRRFPEYERFAVTSVYDPALTGQEQSKIRQIHYQCTR